MDKQAVSAIICHAEAANADIQAIARAPAFTEAKDYNAGVRSCIEAHIRETQPETYATAEIYWCSRQLEQKFSPGLTAADKVYTLVTYDTDLSEKILFPVQVQRVSEVTAAGWVRKRTDMAKVSAGKYVLMWYPREFADIFTKVLVVEIPEGQSPAKPAEPETNAEAKPEYEHAPTAIHGHLSQAIGSMTAAVTAKLDEFAGKLEAIDARAAALLQAFDVLDASVMARFEVIDSRLDGLQSAGPSAQDQQRARPVKAADGRYSDEPYTYTSSAGDDYSYVKLENPKGKPPGRQMFDGCVASIANFDTARLRSRERRDELMAAARHSCSLFPVIG